MRAAALLLLTVLAGCGGTGSTPPPTPDGGAMSLTLVFAPTKPQAASLSLSQAGIQIEAVAVFGDVTPDYRTMLGETHIDMLGAPLSHVFDQAPQGLYSRVRFKLDEITFQGTYGTYPIQARIESESVPAIDLRDPVGQEVAPGQSAVFTVALDGTAWFGDLLAQAQPSNGQIVIDSLQNNVSVGQAIAQRVAAAISLSSAQGPH